MSGGKLTNRERLELTRAAMAEAGADPTSVRCDVALLDQPAGRGDGAIWMLTTAPERDKRAYYRAGQLIGQRFGYAGRSCSYECWLDLVNDPVGKCPHLEAVAS